MLSAIAAIILCRQLPAPFAGLLLPQAEEHRVMSMSTLEVRQYFHQWILPGIEIPQRAGVESQRSIAYLGMAALAGVGTIGLILAGVGLAGIVRRH
jgi:hypothetical protein